MRSEPESMRAHIRGRRAAALAFMWGGWALAMAVGLWAALTFDPSRGHFAPQWVQYAFIGGVGVGIAGGAAVSRLKLAETIVDAFRAGFASAQIGRRTRQHQQHETRK